MARHTKFVSGEVLEFLASVSILTGWGSLRGSLNLSMQIQVEKVRPGVGGKTLSPTPTPPITALSVEARELTPTTLAVLEVWGDKLGM